MKFSLLFLLTILFSNCATQQEKMAEVKFLNAGNKCDISGKEVLNAEELSKEFQFKKLIPLKTALVLTEKRYVDKKSFKDLRCALRFFNDRYIQLDKKTFGGNQQEHFISLMSDYSTLLSNLYKDPNYKKEFEELLKDPSSYETNFSAYNTSLASLEDIDPELGMKLYSSYLSHLKNKELTDGAWILLFKFYYEKKRDAPKELTDVLIDSAAKVPNKRSDFMNIYLKKVDEFSYNSFFKKFFNDMSEYKNEASALFFPIRPSFDVLKVYYASSFVPEKIKCDMAKVGKYNPDLINTLMKNSLLVKEINHPCFQEYFGQYAKIQEGQDSCPQIEFKEGEDKRALIKKLDPSFAHRWVDCRTKCNEEDKCILVKNDRGNYTFFNSIYLKDSSLLPFISQWGASVEDSSKGLQYDFTAEGICREGTCVEKNSACTYDEVHQKIEAELKQNHLLICNQDSDCTTQITTPNCYRVAGSKKAFGEKVASPIAFIVSNRTHNLVRSCGIYQDYRDSCRGEEKPAVVKCENHQCVIGK